MTGLVRRGVLLVSQVRTAVSSGAPISKADPSTAGRPPMMGATEPSSPVLVRYPGSTAGWTGPGSCWRDGAGSSLAGVDPIASLSVEAGTTIAAVLAELGKGQDFGDVATKGHAERAVLKLLASHAGA